MDNSTICFDFGNTRLKYAIFQDDELQEIADLPDTSAQTIKELLNRFQPGKSILSSVIDHDESIEQILRETTSFHLLNASSNLPFTTSVPKPETIGADRLALCAAAVHYYPKKNNLVISTGSCITYNFISQYHSFLGGSISPGMEMRFKAMNYYTAKLPLIKAEWDFPLIGYDTKTNLLSGVLYGLATEIDGVVERYQMKYRNFNVLLTGGDTAFFAHLLKSKIFADPDLLFKGLYAISEQNHDART